METRQVLINAVDNGEVLTVVYHGGTQPGTKRRFAPVGVVGQYVRALALPQEEVRTYFVDKVDVVADDHPAPAYDPALSAARVPGARSQSGDSAHTITISLNDLPRGTSGGVPAIATHGMLGTYDAAKFVNPETGGFQFPRYDTGLNSLVRIRDRTRYNRDTFFSLEDTPLSQYTMEDFEGDFGEAEFDVPGIDCLFKPKNKKHFEPFEYLIRAKDAIDELVACLENRREHPFVTATKRVFSQMERDGFVRSIDVEEEQLLKKLSDSFLRDDLVSMVETLGLTKSGGKIQLTKRLVKAGRLKLPQAILPTELFESLIVALVDVYLAGIRKGVDDFHPLYLEYVWDEVSDANLGEWSYLDVCIDDIRNEKYWLQRLEVPDYMKKQSKRWWKFW